MHQAGRQGEAGHRAGEGLEHGVTGAEGVAPQRGQRTEADPERVRQVAGLSHSDRHTQRHPDPQGAAQPHTVGPQLRHQGHAEALRRPGPPDGRRRQGDRRRTPVDDGTAGDVDVRGHGQHGIRHDAHGERAMQLRHDLGRVDTRTKVVHRAPGELDEVLGAAVLQRREVGLWSASQRGRAGTDAPGADREQLVVAGRRRSVVQHQRREVEHPAQLPEQEHERPVVGTRT